MHTAQHSSDKWMCVFKRQPFQPPPPMAGPVIIQDTPLIALFHEVSLYSSSIRIQAMRHFSATRGENTVITPCTEHPPSQTLGGLCWALGGVTRHLYFLLVLGGLLTKSD